MKIIVIGGTGLIGSKVVGLLSQWGHDAVAAAPTTGVDTLTGEGLAEVLAGADVVVDVSNSPSFENPAVLDFFETSTGNVLGAAVDARVQHVVALSVVGADRLLDSEYMQAKVAQERLLAASPIPWSIVHATQFHEFVGRIADSATVDGTVRIPPVRFQPMAADEVAAAVARTAVGPPRGVVEVAGPRQHRFDELVARALRARGDDRPVVADPDAPYFGATLSEASLVPIGPAELGAVDFDDWLAASDAAA